jgi:hypothetical protein
MFWTGETERDRHVLKGQSSPDLSVTALRFSTATGNRIARDYLTANTDVSLTFTPLFEGVRSGNELGAFGISFDTTTGVCTVDPAAPILRKRNFIVEVVAAPHPPGTPGTTVVRTWLTPSTLTVRPEDDARPELSEFRFTVHAQYDDETVSDITFHHGVTWTPLPNFWTDSRIRLLNADVSGSNFTVRASYHIPGGQPVECQGTVQVAELWANEPNPPTASIVAGGGWPGTIRPQSVPNVLFLGDGFPDAKPFEAITDSFVEHMKKDPMMRPFDRLATSINFWRTFVAGPQGISVRSELYYISQGTKKYARALPVATKPVAGKPWNIEHMIYAVGLPIPADKNRPNNALKLEWGLLLNDDPAPHVSDNLIEQWKALADRVFAQELDAFPGLCYGRPPAANRVDNYMLGLHDGRGDFAIRRTFYRRLASDNGVQLDGNVRLGNLWAEVDTTFQSTHFDNTDLVVIVTAVPGGRAVNGSRYMALGPRSGDLRFEVAQLNDPFREARLTFPRIPANATKDSCRTMTHELAHSFGLGDEYADRPSAYQPQTDFLPAYANLQTGQNVKNAAGTRFVGNLIKWNWHRIRKAALVEGPITGPAAGPFTIPVRLGHGQQFDAGNTVLLRLRRRGRALTASPDVLLPTQELNVVSRTPDSVVVAPAAAGSVTLAQIQRFAPGSIVFIPTPAPSSVKSQTYRYAEIVALNVKNEITNNNRPLWAHPAGDQTDGPTVQPPNLTNIDLPGIDWCFKNKPRIIGLYEGGAQHARDIYHPAGTCMMRNDHDEAAEFCHVCRYVIVDIVDPSKHFGIDLDYGDVYAQG